jgi:hypothetical protein
MIAPFVLELANRCVFPVGWEDFLLGFGISNSLAMSDHRAQSDHISILQRQGGRLEQSGRRVHGFNSGNL